MKGILERRPRSEPYGKRERPCTRQTNDLKHLVLSKIEAAHDRAVQQWTQQAVWWWYEFIVLQTLSSSHIWYEKAGPKTICNTILNFGDDIWYYEVDFHLTPDMVFYHTVQTICKNRGWRVNISKSGQQSGIQSLEIKYLLLGYSYTICGYTNIASTTQRPFLNR